mgnify:CR=1 FL=1
MSKGLTIIDKDYTQWVENLSVRYRQSQIKAAVRVNRELLKYYWELGLSLIHLLCKKILFALFSTPKGCPTNCGTIRG